ncbi:MAG: HD domain-containing protein [Candidatus Azambacteria bacterium]|nr:HD domain-containing protein [Candidatus Azambacteria bacterium]
MNIRGVWDKAVSLRDCLAHQRTVTSRRRYAEDEDPFNVKNCFVSDEAKILSSKAFRVLGDRTQVFTFPETPLIRDRKAHTMEVVASATIATEMLGLNTDLARAAALGHDIGHVPFGHIGEEWIARAMGSKKFCHEIMASIIAQKIERKGRGLNLTWHTLDAMLRHSGTMARAEMSQEAWVVRYADKFAYIFHDVNDIVSRMKYPVSRELMDVVNIFGVSQRERTTTAIAGLVVESADCGRVSFESSALARKFMLLRSLMYEIYPRVTQQNVDSMMEPVFEFLSTLNIGNPFLLLALMTDTDVVKIASRKVRGMQAFNLTSVSEIAPHLPAIGKIDLCDPDLEWNSFNPEKEVMR